MNNKLIFAIAVAVLITILLVTKVVTIIYLYDNALAIGSLLLAIYNWINSREIETKAKEAAKEAQRLRYKLDSREKT